MSENSGKSTVRKNRNTNIELLRVVAMFLIVVYHITVHCVNVQMSDASYLTGAAEIFTRPVFYKRILITDTIMTFGIVGNAIFILISGYFMAENMCDLARAGKTAKKLLLQMGFAAILLVCVPAVCSVVVPGIDGGLQSISIFNSMSWFIGYYFIVLVCGLLFLNRFLAGLDRKKYLAFVLVVFAITQFSYSGNIAESLAQGLRTILTGIALYAFGGYIRKFDPFSKTRSYTFIIIIAVTYMLVWISEYNETAARIAAYINSSSTDPFYQSVPIFDNFSIVIIIIAVCVFELFRRMKIPYNGIINNLGSATLMIYLLHDNDFFYRVWNVHDWVTDFASSPGIFVLTLFKWALMTFCVGILAYIIYEGMMKLVNKMKSGDDRNGTKA